MTIAKTVSSRTAFVPSSTIFQKSCIAGQRSSCHRVSNLNTLMAIDGTTISLALDPAFTLTPATETALSPSGISPIQEFEPVLNTQAASSFVVIAVVFTILQLRINAVSGAAKRRSSSLEELRKIESLQLTAPDAQRPTEMQVAKAKEEYENALRAEMDLRTIIPGVRIVAPNDPKRDEEERAAAKRFLGWGSDEFGDDPEEEMERLNNLALEKSNDGNVQNENDKPNPNTGLSGGAQVILFGVASILIVLLWTLSFDPMVADQVFTTLGGSPPPNMPLTSW